MYNTVIWQKEQQELVVKEEKLQREQRKDLMQSMQCWLKKLAKRCATLEKSAQ